MRPPWVDKLEKVGFIAGLAVLAFLYGFATRTFGWPPSDFLDQAWLQARAGTTDQPPDFTTPRVYDRHGVRVVDAGRMQPGPTLISTVWEQEDDWLPGLKLVDREGRSLHQWRVDPEALFAESASRRKGLGLDQLDIQGSYLFPDGDVLANIEYVGTVRLSPCGEVRWTLPAGSHHSIHPAGDGSFWIPTVTERALPASEGHPRGFPGLRGPAFHDRVTRVSADGRILEAIDLLDVIYDNGLQVYIAKANFAWGNDPTHLNDIEPLPPEMADEYPLFEAGDLVVSLKHMDLVFVLDPESGEVRWHASDPFLRQHDPDFMGDGWIGVFDNRPDATYRGQMLGGSRIVAVQPHTSATRVLFPTRASDPFFTSVRGKWQRLQNGNLLLAESEAGRAVEVAHDGSTVWEWIVEPYSESRTPYVSRATRLDLTPDQVAAWPCSRVSSSDDEDAES